MGHEGMNIDGTTPGITFFINEGNFTRNENMDTDFGPSKGGAFASRGNKGLEVQIDPTDDMTCTPLTTGVGLGRITSADPEGPLPRANKTAGNYPKRIVRVEPDGKIDKVRLADTHAAIVPGNSLAVDLTDKSRYVLEEDVTTNVFALQAKSANEGGFIKVLRKGASQVAAD